MSIRILLADDHNFVREGLRSLLPSTKVGPRSINAASHLLHQPLRYLAYPPKVIPDYIILF